MASPETHPVAVSHCQGYPRITKSSPVRDLIPGELDYERCAALHNELLSLLRPPAVEFLKPAYVEPPLLPESGTLIHSLQGLAEPTRMVDVCVGYENEAPPGTFIRLYELSRFREGDNEGILLNQDTMKASCIADYNDTPGVRALPFAWKPLEVILDAHLRMIDEGKSRRLLMKGQMAAAAFKRLVIAIHARMPEEDDSKDEDKDKIASTNWMKLPWHDPSTLMQQHPNILPPSSFAKEFLTATAHIKVRFRYVAPGLRFPAVTRVPQPAAHHKLLDKQTTPPPPPNSVGQFPGNCPLKIFQVVCDKPIPDPHIPHWTNPHSFPAAFYIHPVVQKPPLCYSNGCHLALPFAIGKKGHARKSNGEPFGKDNLGYKPDPRNEHAGLYQPGMTDGFGDYHDVQIDKVLRIWAERVERGDWDVDGDGVAGGIEKFREADTEEHWEEYWIPPSW
ncbi:hypothetical protein BDW69DRAFT_201026 [Aspergillus filifer]